MEENPKVFISYSHDSDEHKKWVLELATRLRCHGVDVILDQWDLVLGNDLRFFMEQGLDESEFVICICSSKYVERTNSGVGGVGYETTIISSDLLMNSNTGNILPIIKNNEGKEKTPKFLLNKIYSNFDEGDYYSEYRQLIEKIYGENAKKKPPLGNNPFQSRVSSEIHIKNELEKGRYVTLDRVGTAQFDYSKNNGTFSIGEGSMLFKTKWSGCSNHCIYAYSDSGSLVGYLPEEKEFPEESDLHKFDYTSRVVTVYENEIVIFENSFGKFLAVKIISVDSKSHGKKTDYLEFEYKILSDI